MKLDVFLTPYTKINSRWVKGLNVRVAAKRTKTKTETKHNSEDSIAVNLHDLGLGNDFLDISKAQATKEKK